MSSDIEKELAEIKKKIETNQELLKDPGNQELFVLAEEELKDLQEKERDLQEQLNKVNAIIIEIRAGAGGEEAALFAADLFRMYTKYAQNQAWPVKILNSQRTELGGIKEIIFEIKNDNAWPKMKYEGGVHRVQRIPETEKSGRIHTSTATVAVLLKPKKAQIKIDPKDLRIDVYKSSGAGGQYVNKRETAVRITHLPTGLVVTCQNERNLLQNKENALSVLEARLLEKKQREEDEKMSGKRKAQIGWAMRAEKIRTYNFPQDRITDHRIRKSWHNIEKIIDGDLEPIIKTIARSQA